MSLFFLIGMPGAGKTYWGEKVAIHCGLVYIDMDNYIEQQEQKSIADIFLLHREETFREKEKLTLQKIIAGQKQAVVACGGGTPCFFNNMMLMKNAGTVIYLQAKTSTLMRRLQDELHLRPLLAQQQNLIEYLENTLQARKHWYEQADYILQAEELHIAAFDEIIGFKGTSL